MPVLYAVFIIFSLAVSVQDAVTGKIPRILFILYGAFLLFHTVLYDISGLSARLVCALYAVAIFLLVRKLSHGGMGLADVWFAGAGAGTLPFFAWHIATAAGCAAAIVFILVKGKRKIPFVPFMGAGCVFAVIAETIKQK